MYDNVSVEYLSDLLCKLQQVKEPQFPKRCSCGVVYDIYSWVLLPDRKDWDLKDGEILEQRHCPCGSHIVIVTREYSGE